MDALRCTYTTSPHHIVLFGCFAPLYISQLFLSSPQYMGESWHGPVHELPFSRVMNYVSAPRALSKTGRQKTRRRAAQILILRSLRSCRVGDPWDSIFPPSRNKVQFFPSPALFKQPPNFALSLAPPSFAQRKRATARANSADQNSRGNGVSFSTF